MALNVGILVPYTGTHASLPAGFTRDDRLNDVFVKCQDAGVNSDFTVFGSDTHTHTSPSHTPIQDSHTHFFNSGPSTGTTTYKDTGLNSLSSDGHSHDYAESDPTVATNQGVAITVNTASNDPPYRKVIWLRSDGSAVGVPNNGLALLESDVVPSGWARSETNNFLKGAAAAADGTGTGGSSTHTHTSPAHTHIQDAHNHIGVSEQGDLSVIGGSASLNGPVATHVHVVTLDDATAINNPVTTTLSTSAAEPVYKKINVIKNTSGGFDIQTDMILFWEGSHLGIPADWQRYTSLDGFFFKGAAAGEFGTTGGNTTHGHSASDCQPTQITHSHSITAGLGDAVLRKGSGVSNIAATNHTHTWTSAENSGGNQAAAVTINSIASEVAYPRHVKLIPVKYAPVAPSFTTASFLARTIRAQKSTSFRSKLTNVSRGTKSFSQSQGRKSTIKRELKK